MSASQAIQSDAAALLGDGRAKMIVGYRQRGQDRVPAFVTDAGQVETLIYDDQCTQNLASYLRKAEICGQMPVAVVAAPAAMRSLVLLTAEKQIKDDQVIVLGVDGQTYHGTMDLAAVAALLQERYADLTYEQSDQDRLAQLEAMSADERAAFWREQLAKCTRCYACRAACPGCYCTRCIVEKNTPQWISTAALEHGNYAWNVIRAFHLAMATLGSEQKDAGAPVPAGMLAIFYAGAQDWPAVYKELERALDEGGPLVFFPICLERLFGPIHDEPEFKAYRAKLNLPN